MWALTGITGQVGGALARSLLAQERLVRAQVRAIVRDTAKAATWAARGCELAQADMTDAAAMTAAFHGCEGVFILLPPNFDPSPGFPESRAVIAAVREALLAARPKRVVVLSTVGAQAVQQSLLSQLGLLEQALADVPLPITFLRPAWFIENLQWDIAAVRASGELPAFLQPLDRRIPMVATEDVGRAAAELLLEDWDGHRVVELAGPADVSPQDMAQALARRLGRPVQAVAVPRGEWEARFRAQGMQHPLPRMQMLDGFNAGWLTFERTPRRGLLGLEQVIEQLLRRA
ncbi:NAD(P)H-binding protein [Ideonella azotifigens]|uniref:NAD(P)H-binding protein n=1 Tax=Ideonella azotifigens TaxID=513160 RepID=A0ABN1JWW7_9BURK|nr:NAD(P)H-binding protein [Ideonella azotifigens]MCD2341241.1 NAD(P)H-binding protein [Ideonella azotifigens]